MQGICWNKGCFYQCPEQDVFKTQQHYFKRALCRKKEKNCENSRQS